MLNNYFTLLQICAEARERIMGAKVGRALSQRKGTLEILFDLTSGDRAKAVVSCVPQKNFFYLEVIRTGKEKGANVLHQAIGKAVQSIRVVENERAVDVEFTDGTSLILQLFGSSANAYYTDQQGTILDSFLKPGEHIGQKLSPVPEVAKTFPESSDALKTNLLQIEGTLLRKLPKAVPGFDLLLSREVLFRYRKLYEESIKIEEDNPGLESPGDYEHLFETIVGMRSELLNPRPGIYATDTGPLTFSLVPLEHIGSVRFEACDSVNDCVKRFATTSERSADILGLKRNVSAKLARNLGSLQRTLAKIETDISNDRTAVYQATAEWIMANLDSFRPGADSVTVNVKGKVVEARLDPSISPIRNAQLFFEKSKRAKASVRQADERKSQIAHEIEKMKSLVREVDDSYDPLFLASLSKKVIKDDSDHLPFRVFEKSGYKIYVGKDARSNDQLTFGFAKPNDVFLHARGVTGSHVIIRNSSRDYPEKRVIEYAAMVAAHYSKARTSNIVPVAYTMRKFVKKGKGTPGLVVMSREEVVFVNSGDWARQ